MSTQPDSLAGIELRHVGFVGAAIAVALVPGVVAGRFYPRDRALLLTGGVFLGYFVLAASLIRFYGVCGGPGC